MRGPVCLLCLLLFPEVSWAQSTPGVAEGLLFMLEKIIKQYNDEPKDVPYLQVEYDFIIVGAGTAGCALANRLTEIGEWKVLLLEAGGSENFIMDIPLLVNFLQFTDVNWKYKTVPSNTSCLGLKGRQCNFPRGKVMGGSSVLNYMIYTRGHPKDYDKWASLGNDGWSYEEVLPYFMKSEDMKVPDLARDKKHHSRGGYLTLSYAPYRTPLADAFIRSGLQTGQNIVDYNTEKMVGFGYLQSTMKNGTRWSSSRAFLHPIHHRKNLDVRKMSMVTKILIDPKTKVAYGVEMMYRNKRYVIRATKEIILSSGAINSPQLLMLSGIGPRKHLESIGIQVVKDLAVGYNLMDHVSFGGLTFIVNQSVSLITERIIDQKNLADYFAYHTGPISIPGGCEALAFYDLKNPNNPNGHPDIELLFQSGSIASEETLRENFGINNEIYDAVYKPIQKADTWLVLPMLMRPKSRGRIMLRDKNPFHHPLISPNYFEYEEDLDTLVGGIRKTIELSQMEAFQKFGTRLHNIPIPACRIHRFGSDDYWKCAIRHLPFTIYHLSGTCKMGPMSDPTAVVDPRLKVHGVGGLRVIDASIIPEIPVGHTNGPAFMIAEKGADLIKEDWGKKKYR